MSMYSRFGKEHRGSEENKERLFSSRLLYNSEKDGKCIETALHLIIVLTITGSSSLGPSSVPCQFLSSSLPRFQYESQRSEQSLQSQ
jgi:hypothetical protein